MAGWRGPWTFVGHSYACGWFEHEPPTGSIGFQLESPGQGETYLPPAANGPGKSLFGVKQQVHSINKLGQTLK